MDKRWKATTTGEEREREMIEKVERVFSHV